MSGETAQQGRVYLRSYLAPLNFILERADVTDIDVNRPGELWAETLGGAIERHDAPGLDEATLSRLARQVAALSHQGISREHPLLSATLPELAPLGLDSGAKGYNPCCVLCYERLRAEAYVN